MKFSIISDTHFGDHDCALVTENNGTMSCGNRYEDFKNAAGPDNDYLILAGDIFDFSIASYDKAYRHGQFFFQQIQKDHIIKQTNDGRFGSIIYVAGNHDADIWHLLQHERSVIHKLQKGECPESFEHSVAGIIDDRSGTTKEKKGFTLDKVTVRTGKTGAKYGGMFLDTITTPPTIFNFAYPNLYIINDNEAVLVTHGQYLEPYWTILGEMSMKLAYDDLKVGEVDIEEMVELNFPLNQLGCTGIGQAGVLTNVIRLVQSDIKSGNLSRVKKYLNRLEKVIDDLTECGWLKEIVIDYILGKFKDGIFESIGKIVKTRYSEEFIYNKDVRQRFKRFYKASLLEIGDINFRTDLNIPAPWRIIFGHTHQPIPWNEPNPPKFDSVSSAAPKRLILNNTGGWLAQKGKFCGAEVFTYQSGKGFASVPIR